MKGGLCLVYTSLLTVSVLSSCALFIIVVCEALQSDLNSTFDADGLHNVSQKKTSNNENLGDTSKSDSMHSEDYHKPFIKSTIVDDEMTFAETLSLNSVTTERLPDTGQPPILMSLGDTANAELQSPDLLLFNNESEQHNNTKPLLMVENGDSVNGDEKEQSEDVIQNKDAESAPEATLVVKAIPMHEARQNDEAFFPSTSAPLNPPETVIESPDIKLDKENELDNKDNLIKSDVPQEDIPSFSEWAQKQLAEAEKETVLNHSSQPSHSNTNINNKNVKVRSKNYASPACGAKVVAVNPEARSASSILSSNKDEYMLNTCNSRIWFVVELCEAVQAQKVEIANFELFSSTPKDFTIYFSDRFPTREWASVGQFTAKDAKIVQSFDLYPHMFGKFIKVEMLSHYGSEHYCPVSLFKVYGTSEFEVLEKENSQHSAHTDEDDDENIEVPDGSESETTKNLFGSAKDAVMSIMKKAAEVLVKTEVPKNMSSEHNDTVQIFKKCCSPSHIIVCDNCSDTLYNEVHDLISCTADELSNLINLVFIRDTFKCSGLCLQFGLDFKSTKTTAFPNERIAYLNAIFPKKVIAALCNILAVKEQKVVLNTSFESELNTTTNINIDSSHNTSNQMKEINDIQSPIGQVSSNDEDFNKVSSELEMEVPAESAQIENVSTIIEKLSPHENKDVPEKDNIATKDDNKSNKDDTNQDSSVVSISTSNKTVDSESDAVNEIKNDQENTNASVKDNPNNINNEEKAEKTQKPNGNFVEEHNDQINLDSDSFITDYDQLTIDPTLSSSTTTLPNTQTPQKESVFLRLSNRVKTLERNMSLSGQYLEELSRRYKKQVEEMQKSFEKTVLQMTEERRKSNEREQRYLDQMSHLQEQMAQMATAMKILMEERDSWLGNMTFTKFILFQTLILSVVLYYIFKKRPQETPKVFNKKSTKQKKNQGNKLRRKSVEGVSGHETPSAKKRRPSEEALEIARICSEEEDEGEWQMAKKNRKRKTSILHRNMEFGQCYPQFIRQDSISLLKENAIPLDEEEFLAPVPEPTKFDSLPDQKKDQLKNNGSLLNNLKAKSKTRRLSSPGFLRSFSRQSSRSASSQVIKTIEPLYNGKIKKKASSESPTGSIWSNMTEASQINGRCDIDSVNPKSKKKSLKNMFKKVF